MLPPDLPAFEDMSEQDLLHLRNLALLRAQAPTEAQLTLVENLARSLSEPRLLTLIARTSHWLIHAPVLVNLAQNEATPEAIRRDLELAESIMDLMHGLDRAAPAEREERSETVKQTYAQLPPDLKGILKIQMKQLARQVNRTGQTLELPPIPTEPVDWLALMTPPACEPSAPVRLSREERSQRARSTHDPKELVDCLLDPDADVRREALDNPVLSEERLQEALYASVVSEFFEEVYAEARWYFREAIREAIYAAPGCPTALARRIRQSSDLVFHLEQAARSRADLRRITALFSQLDESEYQYVTLWAKRHTPGLLRVVKIFFDRLQRARSSQSRGLNARGSEGRWASLEERVFLANQTQQPDQLIAALRDPDPQVFTVVLENPVLTPREMLAAIPSFDTQRADQVARHCTWSEQAVVREALLHNPMLSASTGLRLLESLNTSRALLDVLRDSRIPHLEVKDRALEKLRSLYLSLDIQQRILLVRSTGGEIFRHLPSEALKDEPMLMQLLSDRQMDPTILLRLARNKQTPRNILERIASHPILMAHPAIMSELLLNPKTPRESAIRIWGLLSDSEQQQLLRSPHLPAALRYLGS